VAQEIVVASSDAEYDAFGALIREYWDWLTERYAEVPGLIDTVSDVQALDVELANLRRTYGPPAGRTLLALSDGEVAGGVAYRDLNDGSCEMKRLYVPARFQGKGLGRQLCAAVITLAAADGYQVMRLDTGFLNSEALAMYESMGFRECPPYHDYHLPIMAYLKFLELPLMPGAPEDVPGTS
jgi:GNAT superfamily N-acetyltransferase